MEDQPADTGDLTPDAAETTPDEDHETPAGEADDDTDTASADAESSDEADDTETVTEDAEAEPADEADDADAEPADDADDAETATEDAEADEKTEPDEAPAETTPPSRRRAHRMPIGKARRALKPPAAVPVGEPEVKADSPVDAEPVTDAQAADTPTDEAVQANDEAEIESAATDTTETNAEAETGDADETAEAVEPATSGADAADEDAADEDTADSTATAVRKPVGKRLKIAIVAAVAVFVAAGAFAGAAVQPYLADRALVETKLDIARTAANAITTLWTYTPDNMDSLPDRSAKYLGGDFESAYRSYVDAIASSNKQAQVTNNTQVLGTAVESLSPSGATAVVYTNSTATSPLTNGVPSLRYLSYRLTMERRDTNWLITKMTTITSLDLTPRL